MKKPTGNRLAGVISIILIFCCLSSYADDEISIDCKIPEPKETLFSDLYKKSDLVAIKLCHDLLLYKNNPNDVNNAALRTAFLDLASEAENALTDKKITPTQEYKAQFEQLKKDFSVFEISSMKFPAFNLAQNNKLGFFQPLSGNVNDIVIQDSCGEIKDATKCMELYKDFGEVFNTYQLPFKAAYDDNSVKLTQLDSRWDRFLEASKSQLFWEVEATTWMQSKHFQQNHLVGPPKYQAILIHPELIYDTMQSAPDGSNQAAGLAVEWVGINAWDWKVPLGVSITSVYVDRAKAQDVGYGLMLHINNNYSIGWATHDGEDSFYVSLDLLKLFADKKSEYDRYRGK